MNTTCFWLEGESQGKQKGLSPIRFTPLLPLALPCSRPASLPAQCHLPVEQQHENVGQGKKKREEFTNGSK